MEWRVLGDLEGVRFLKHIFLQCSIFKKLIINFKFKKFKIKYSKHSKLHIYVLNFLVYKVW